MNKIIVDNDKCTGCKICYRACWLDVIRWKEEEKRPEGKYAEDCIACNFCEISCPVDAIKVEIDYSIPFPSPYIAGKDE